MPMESFVGELAVFSNKSKKEKYMPVSIHEEEFWRRIMIPVTESLWEGIWDELIFQS